MSDYVKLVQQFSDAVRDLAYCDSPDVGYFTRLDDAQSALLAELAEKDAELERHRALVEDVQEQAAREWRFGHVGMAQKMLDRHGFGDPS